MLVLSGRAAYGLVLVGIHRKCDELGKMVNEQQLRTLVIPACEQFGVRELSLFGSRARGNARADSDYDFLVVFDLTKAGRLSDRYFGLLFFGEDQLASRIDLLEENAIRNPYLRKAITHDKKINL